MNSEPFSNNPEIPKSIRILGKDFEVEILEKGDREDVDGLMHLSKHLISLRVEGLAPAYVQDTLLHEVVHAVDETLGAGMTEHQVHLLATGLLAVLRENPHFLAWLLK